MAVANERGGGEGGSDGEEDLDLDEMALGALGAAAGGGGGVRGPSPTPPPLGSASRTGGGGGGGGKRKAADGGAEGSQVREEEGCWEGRATLKAGKGLLPSFGRGGGNLLDGPVSEKGGVVSSVMSFVSAAILELCFTRVQWHMHPYRIYKCGLMSPHSHLSRTLLP